MSAGSSGCVHISAGCWKRQRIIFPSVMGLRPTLARTRETMFDWLMHDITGAHCLDLFAGSGALGLEALSRGAESVVFVDENPRLTKAISGHLQRWEVAPNAHQVCCGRFPKVVSRFGGRTFDVVFVDPPYQQISLVEVLGVLLQVGCVKSDALVVYEGVTTDLGKFSVSFNSVRVKQAGKVSFGLLKVK